MTLRCMFCKVDVPIDDIETHECQSPETCGVCHECQTAGHCECHNHDEPSTITSRLLRIAARYSWLLGLAPILHLILHLLGIPHAESIGLIP